MAHISIPIDEINQNISLLAISPNARYVVTFNEDSNKNNCSIIGYNVSSSGPFIIDSILNELPYTNISKLEVSDDKKIYINFDNPVKLKHERQLTNHLIYDTKTLKRIKLSPNIQGLYSPIFLPNGDFVLLGKEKVFIFSTKTTKNSKWLCKKILIVTKHYEDIEDIGIHKNNIYICDNDYIFFKNFENLKSFPLSFPFGNRCKVKKIISNDELTVILFDENDFVVYRNGFDIPVFKSVLNFKFNTNRYIIGNYKTNSGDGTSTIDIFDLSTAKIHKNIDLVNYEEFNELCECKFIENKRKAFGISGGQVRMFSLSKFDTIITNKLKNFSDKGLTEFDGNIFAQLSLNSNLEDELLELLLKKFQFTFDDPQEFEWKCEDQNLCIYNNKKEKLTETGLTYLPHNIKAYLKENNVCLTNNEVILIYHYDSEENKMKTLRKWDINFFNDAVKMIKGEDLSVDNFEECICDIVLNTEKSEYYLGNEWLHFIINDDFLFSKYAETILRLAIKEHKSKLVKSVYSKCLRKYNEDPIWNIGYLEFICQQLNYLQDYYPEHLSDFYSKFAFILNPYCEGVQYLSDSHLHAFHHTFELMDYKLYGFHRKLYGISFPFSVSRFVRSLIFYKNPSTPNSPTLIFLVPLPKYVCYPKDYNWWNEIFKPKPSIFVKTINNEFYDTWNGEAILNFKWNNYGKYYYFGIWSYFMIFFGCFTIASTVPPNYLSNNIRTYLLIICTVLGIIHLVIFEIRQFIWNSKKWIFNPWNFFGLGSFAVPTAIALYSVYGIIIYDKFEKYKPAMAMSILLLDIKFLLFFRVFESFGKYFAIMIDVAKEVRSFIVILSMIIASFAHSFYALLQHPVRIPTLFFILVGDTETYKEELLPNEIPPLTVLFILFTFTIVIYLMNLFIGLLNISIVENAKISRSKYLAHKAEIIAEIELFYMLPHQRRNRSWFPEIIKYYVKVDKLRKEVNDLIEREKWKPGRITPIQERLLKELNIEFDEI